VLLLLGDRAESIWVTRIPYSSINS
jgi:hypothetical protein